MDRQSPPWLAPFLKRFLNPSQDSLTFLESLVRNNDIARLPVINPNYIVNDPEMIYHILLTNADNYTKAGTSYERIEHVVGKGLLTTSGAEWAMRHKAYQPLFHGKHLKKYVATIHKYTGMLLTKWTEQNARQIAINDEMLALVMNISAEAFIGLDVSDRSLELVKMIHILNNFAVTSLTLWKWMPTLRNLRYQIAKKAVDQFILTSLKENKTANEPIFKELLIKKELGGISLSEDELLSEIKNFFIAGHETTGNSLSWTLYCLAKNRYVLVELIREINTVLGGDLPDYESIEQMPYLDMVIQESLRLYPAIWIFTRRAIAQDSLGHCIIPAKAIINIIPYLLHRHPKYWNQPNIFYPERFSSDQVKNRPRCAYIPFGFGPRVCIGRQFALLNIKIILIMILQQFDVQLPRNNYVVEPQALITLKPKNLKLKVINRSSSDTA